MKRTGLEKLIKYSWILIIIGILLSLASMVLPFLKIVNQEIISTAGTISSSIASIFGLGIASLAIWVYLEKEDARNIQSENALLGKNKLEVALNNLSHMIRNSQHYIRGKQSNNVVDNFVRNINSTISYVNEILHESRKSEIGIVLSNVNIDKTNLTGFFALILLNEKLTNYQLQNHLDPELNNNLIIKLTAHLSEALNNIDQSNVRTLLLSKTNTSNLEAIVDWKNEILMEEKENHS